MRWDVSSQWPGPLPDDILRPSVTKEVLQQKYDMDYFVTDLIDAPPYVLKTLCMEKYINKYPVALKCSKEQAVVNSGIFRKFAIGQTLYNVITSRYGEQGKQTTTTMVRNAEFLGDSSKLILGFKYTVFD